MAARETPIAVTKGAFQLLSREEQRVVAKLVREGVMVLVDRRQGIPA